FMICVQAHKNLCDRTSQSGVIAGFAHVFSMVTVDLAGDLRRQIAAKQVVCFVGAGVSVASAPPGSGVLWTELIESGARWVDHVHPLLPANWLEDRLRALASEDVDDLLAAASQVASKLGAPDGGEYSEWL